MDAGDALSKALSGRRSQKWTDKQMLNDAKTAYAGQTWKQLAQESGISERTLRRLRKGGKPAASTRAKLDSLGKKPEVRQAAMKPNARRRRNRAVGTGARIKVTANQGPAGRGGDYKRPRTVDFTAPADVMEAIYDAYDNGDEDQAAALLEDAVAEHGWGDWDPAGGWSIGGVDELDIR